ncbi:MAG: aminoglycoside phosphotransferase family protein [Planctomycetota bacterium]
MLTLINNYLEQNWKQIVPSIPKTDNLKFLLMSGGLARNLKATFLVFTDKPTPLIIVRIADDACGKDYIRQEYNNLTTLSNKYQMSNAAPQALHLTEIENHLLLFQSCVNGTLLLKHKQFDLFAQTCDWLFTFHLKTKQDSISRESYIQNIKTQIDLIAKSIEISPELRELFAEIHKKCDKLPKGITVLSHNDFSPRNIMIGRDGRVSGVIDWEYAQPQGMPLRDLYHLAGYYYPAKGHNELLANFQRTFFEQNSFSSLVREKIISYCNTLELDIASVELFFWLYLILPMEESIRLSMPYFPLWKGKLFVLESLVKQRHNLKFIL